MNLILGFGKTGASFVRYLKNKDLSFLIMDSRLDPPGLLQFKDLSKKNLILGGFDLNVLGKVKRVLVSPGINFHSKILKEARNLGIKIQTDIEIFLEETRSKTILVTGTNAKTTVVSMAGHLLKKVYGEDQVICCGNIGKPVLDIIQADNLISVVEVSSFHLEHSKILPSDIAVLLNIQQDHLDRHLSFERYSQIKQRILLNTNTGLVGIKDLNPELLCKENILNYEDLLEPLKKEISSSINKEWPLHELENVKAVISIYIALEALYGNLDINKIEKENLSLIKKNINLIHSFVRLPHRFEVLGTKKGITYINDSKSTNISSLVVAVNSAERKYGKNKILLICGGDSKAQDFSSISQGSLDSIKHIFTFGKDKEIIMNNLKNKVECTVTKDLKNALLNARSFSKEGDVIMLSPACSSTDMFSDYKERGMKFRELTGFM